METKKNTRNLARCRDKRRPCVDMLVVRIPTQLKTKLTRYAEECGMSISATLRMMIKSL